MKCGRKIIGGYSTLSILALLGFQKPSAVCFVLLGLPLITLSLKIHLWPPANTIHGPTLDCFKNLLRHYEFYDLVESRIGYDTSTNSQLKSKFKFIHSTMCSPHVQFISLDPDEVDSGQLYVRASVTAANKDNCNCNCKL